MNEQKINTEYKNRRNVKKRGISFLLENIRSASNIGSVFRTADAFGINTIYLCGICAVPPNKEILKTALGATETVKWEYHQDAAILLRQLIEDKDLQVIAIEQDPHSIPLSKFEPEPDKNLLLILGNELNGVSRELMKLSHHIAEIPQSGSKKSLNISVAAGIAAWELMDKSEMHEE